MGYPHFWQCLNQMVQNELCNFCKYIIYSIYLFTVYFVFTTQRSKKVFSVLFHIFSNFTHIFLSSQKYSHMWVHSTCVQDSLEAGLYNIPNPQRSIKTNVFSFSLDGTFCCRNCLTEIQILFNESRRFWNCYPLLVNAKTVFNWMIQDSMDLDPF